jgi:hypothetical protein
MLAILYIGILLLSVPAAITLGVLFALSKRKICLIAALLWLLPVTYEYWVQVNCTGECNIRVDLLLVIPFELFVLGWASTAAYRAFVSARRLKHSGPGTT